MGAFESIVTTMASMDVFSLFFPWLLVLSVTYGVLEKYSIFSGESEVNGVIALSVAFFSIGGAYFFLPQGILTSLAAGLTFSMFGLLGFLLLLGVAGFDLTSEKLAGDPYSLPGIGALVFTLLSFLGAFAFTADISALTKGVSNVWDEIVLPVLTLVFLLVVVSLTTRGD
ncbi:MAG: hypothetical protein ABEJ91_02375 [Candidatus Nanohaloarchaea archaeon]